MKKLKKYLAVLTLLLTLGGVISTTKIANAQSIRYKYIHKDRNGKVRTRKDKVRQYQLVYSKDKKHIIALIDDKTSILNSSSIDLGGPSEGQIIPKNTTDYTVSTQLYLIDTLSQQGYHLVSTSSRDLLRGMQVRLYFEK